MELSDTKWVILNAGIDLDHFVIRFEKDGSIAQMQNGHEITDIRNFWSLEKDFIIIHLINAGIFIGKSIEEQKFIGKLRNDKGKERLFLLIRCKEWVFEPKKQSLINKNILINVRWKITPEQASKEISFHITFKKDGSLFTSSSSQLNHNAWEMEDDGFLFTTKNRALKHTGKFKGAGFYGTTILLKNRSWKYHAELDYNQVLNTHFSKYNRYLNASIINSRWELKLAKTKSMLDTSKTIRIIELNESGDLDYFDEYGLPLKNNNKWTARGKLLVAVLNSGKSSFTAQIIDNSIIGEGINDNGKVWHFDGKRVTIKGFSLNKDHSDMNIDKPFKMFTREDFNDDNQILHLGIYHKYWAVYKEVRNPDFDNYSSMILGLKEEKSYAIDYFYNKLNLLIAADELAICYVPSSDPMHIDSGIKKVAKKLSIHRGRINATDCIIRTKKIPKLATGGDRSISVHLNSLKVINKDEIFGKNILLLDDVTTTNNSLIACKRLLLEAGASKVYCFALGQTS